MRRPPTPALAGEFPHRIAARLHRCAGEPVGGPYVRACWLPIIGPSTLLVTLTCADLADAGEDVEIAELGALLGLAEENVRRALARAVRFRFLGWRQGVLLVPSAVLPVPAHLVERLPERARRVHEATVERVRLVSVV